MNRCAWTHPADGRRCCRPDPHPGDKHLLLRWPLTPGGAERVMCAWGMQPLVAMCIAPDALRGVGDDPQVVVEQRIIDATVRTLRLTPDHNLGEEASRG